MTEPEAATAPLVVEFSVGVSPELAFDAWVRRTRLWWPRDHTITGDPAAIVFEPTPGGRIFERDGDGNEYGWGAVQEWEPPHRIRFRWHLFFAPEEATTVSLSFMPVDGSTVVRLEQTGWEALGEQGAARRERTTAGWATVTDPYRRFVAGAAATSTRSEETT